MFIHNSCSKHGLSVLHSLMSGKLKISIIILASITCVMVRVKNYQCIYYYCPLHNRADISRHSYWRGHFLDHLGLCNLVRCNVFSRTETNLKYFCKSNRGPKRYKCLYPMHIRHRLWIENELWVGNIVIIMSVIIEQYNFKFHELQLHYNNMVSKPIIKYYFPCVNNITLAAHGKSWKK